MGSDCTKSSISLPVIDSKASRQPRSTRGKWRAAVLIAVHVAIAAHIAQWLITGSTVSPVEPSESMETLEVGAVNAGAIFFLLAIVSTVIFGRFFCGWGCHVVALQDLCGWMMKKIRVRPKPFRSRLLVWAPLVLGLYMFVWPTFKRVALFPLIEALGGEAPIWLGAPVPFHGFHSGLIVDDFWATFPSWYVAIPFFGVVGFASVYFLGAKGFCTYGCPYGGIFGVVDRVSPGRIVVNSDCHQCGHCTAVCTSNVRVHEEVRDFGMVVDPGCMKCMDCVSACPNDALSFGFATVPALAKPKDQDARDRQAKITSNPKRFDLTLTEEIVGAVLFVAFTIAFRGMLNQVPLLMAVGMAGVAVFGVWKLKRLVTDPSVRLQSFQLKAAGKIRPVGVVVAIGAVVALAAGVWGASTNSLRMSAHWAHESITVPLTTVLRPEYSPTNETRAIASTVADRYLASASVTEGGIGWSLNAADRRELAFALAITGEPAEAVEQLNRLIDQAAPTSELVRHLGALMRASGSGPLEIRTAFERVLDQHPHLGAIRSEIAAAIGSEGDPGSALELWERRIESADLVASETLDAAEFFASAGQTDRASELISGMEPHDPLLDIRRARLLLALGKTQEALSIAVESEATKTPAGARQLAALFVLLGEIERAVLILEDAAENHPDSVGVAQDLARLLQFVGRTDDALAQIDRAEELVGSEPWQLAAVGESTTRLGLESRSRDLVVRGIDMLKRASDLEPDSPTLLHDLGQAQMAMARFRRGLESLEQAARMDPSNQALQRSLDQARARVPAGAGG